MGEQVVGGGSAAEVGGVMGEGDGAGVGDAVSGGVARRITDGTGGTSGGSSRELRWMGEVWGVGYGFETGVGGQSRIFESE